MGHECKTKKVVMFLVTKVTVRQADPILEKH